MKLQIQTSARPGGCDRGDTTPAHPASVTAVRSRVSPRVRVSSSLPMLRRSPAALLCAPTALRCSPIAFLCSAAALLGLVACSDDDDPAGPSSDPFVFASEPASAYDRVDRMGMPAIATAVISAGMKDAYNAADPTDDAEGDFVADIVANVGALHAALDDDLTGAGLTPCATNDCVSQAAPLVVPDVLRIDLAQPAGFPNGRRLADPVIDVTLAVVLLDLGTHGAGTLAALPLNPVANDVAFSATFPYLAPANP